MTSQRWLNDDEQRAWRLFLAMQAGLSARMSRDLQRTSGLSLADYDVLVNLGDTDDKRLRAFELGQILQWEQSRLSHHLARMERRGLVERESCPDDRRGSFVVLTDEGRVRLAGAAPAHVDTVRSVFFDRLDRADVEHLARLSERVLAALQDAVPPGTTATDR